MGWARFDKISALQRKQLQDCMRHRVSISQNQLDHPVSSVPINFSLPLSHTFRLLTVGRLEQKNLPNGVGCAIPV
jgi:hypothetical protein